MIKRKAHFLTDTLQGQKTHIRAFGTSLATETPDGLLWKFIRFASRQRAENFEMLRGILESILTLRFKAVSLKNMSPKRQNGDLYGSI